MIAFEIAMRLMSGFLYYRFRKDRDGFIENIF